MPKAFTKLAYPAIHAAGGRFLVRTSNVAKTYESAINVLAMARSVTCVSLKPSNTLWEKRAGR